MSEKKAAFLGVNRHRLGVDGHGVVTLCAFMSCPLRCKYCLNQSCHDSSNAAYHLTPQELIEMVVVDNLYFLATNGGITFGGGEPLLNSAFIEEFAKSCDPRWTITLETSLNVAIEHLQRVFPYVDKYYIDIKDLNCKIYEKYTQHSPQKMLNNLQWLMSMPNAVEKVVVRLPHIPSFNNQNDVNCSREILMSMGVKHFDEFDYIVVD